MLLVCVRKRSRNFSTEKFIELLRHAKGAMKGLRRSKDSMASMTESGVCSSKTKPVGSLLVCV